MFQKNVERNQNTNFMPVIFFFENPAVYEIMRKTYGKARLAIDNSTPRSREDVICMPDN